MTEVDPKELELLICQLDKASMIIQTGKAMLQVLDARLLEWGVIESEDEERVMM